jgi:hypothetical protein
MAKNVPWLKQHCATFCTKKMDIQYKMLHFETAIAAFPGFLLFLVICFRYYQPSSGYDIPS